LGEDGVHVADVERARSVSTFAFIHGAGDVGWYWHLVERELRAHGHVTVAPDLPIDDDQAGLGEYAEVVVDAIGGRSDAVLVAQSFGGYVAPLVAERVNSRLIVLVAGMVPAPHESAEEMFVATGWQPTPLEDNSTRAVFYHDVPPDLVDEALRRGERRQSETPGKQAWPLDRWPAVPTRAIVCRQDRFFPVAWLRRVVQERLGMAADEIDGGHCPALSQPRELARRLEDYLATQEHRESG
jgi:pimeloyl-ACP methyl ester carboxylesterase